MEYNHSKIIVVLLLAFSFVLPNVTFAVRGEGTATINGGANVNVVQASSNVFTIVLTVGASGITADAENPTFTIPTGFTAPDATYVANAGLVVADGNWSVIGGGTCLVESPVVGLTAASGQVITVDVSTACTVGPGGTITLTYKGTSNTVGVVSVDVATNDVISAQPVKSISLAPNSATLPTITVTAADITAPTVTVTMDDDALNIGDTSLVTFTFSETPVGFTTADVTVANGAIGAIDASNPLAQTATYTPTNSIEDATNVITVGTAWTDAALNTGVGDDSPNYTIDTIAPTVTVTMSDAVLTTSETALVTFTFSETPVGFTTADVTVANGSIGAIDASNPLVQTATYTPTNAITDLTNVITAGTSWTDAALNAGVGDNSPNYSIDTTAATETITVIKLVVGGGKVIADFPLFVNGSPVTSGVANSFPAPAIYTITETSNANYTASYSGFCPGGILSLTLGTPKICTITNTYTAPPIPGSGGLIVASAPPLIDLVKVPSPLSLPGGPGPVSYTYTLRNIGVVAMSNVAVVDNKCSAVSFVGGDTNGDSKLDVNEIWTYRCTTQVSQTTTNTATATGWANSITATDIASATVVVGVALIPPLIHITKVPSAFLLSAPGGVTYTYAVTNPGTVPLSNVSVVDDKCTSLPGRVLGHPGDLNKNNLLESNETWTFTCQTNLTTTTTNTGIASGSGNGLTATDFALATVVVPTPVPKLPNTGFPPKENDTLIILMGVLATSFIFYIYGKLSQKYY